MGVQDRNPVLAAAWLRDAKGIFKELIRWSIEFSRKDMHTKSYESLAFGTDLWCGALG